MSNKHVYICDAYLSKNSLNNVLSKLEKFLGLSLLNCVVDFFVMFFMQFVHFSGNDKMLNTRMW